MLLVISIKRFKMHRNQLQMRKLMIFLMVGKLFWVANDLNAQRHYFSLLQLVMNSTEFTNTATMLSCDVKLSKEKIFLRM